MASMMTTVPWPWNHHGAARTTAARVLGQDKLAEVEAAAHVPGMRADCARSVDVLTRW